MRYTVKTKTLLNFKPHFVQSRSIEKLHVYIPHRPEETKLGKYTVKTVSFKPHFVRSRSIEKLYTCMYLPHPAETYT